MPSITRRAALLGTIAAAACARGTVYSQAAEQGLQELASARGLDYGSMVTWKSWDGDDAINRDDAFSQLVLRECGLIVSAMEMFWRLNSQSPGAMDFSGADDLVDWGVKHGKKVRGHNLLWHGQTPGWYKSIGDKAYAEKMLVEHVSGMCGRFAGRMHSWDVVNEILDPRSDRPDGLRDNAFLQQLGPGYVDLAFRTARQADPKALLVINDYNLEYDIDHNEKKRRILLALLDGMKQRGTPVDAVGIQSHLWLKERDRFDQNVLAAFLKEISDRGLAIMVTELDVIDSSAPGDIAARDAEVASMYKDYLSVALANPATKTVITWGLADPDSWISHYAIDEFRRADGLPPRPLPFDGEFKPKPAYFAIADAFKAAPAR
ncbi:MAG TPA: endo-1,4-beta-xylanase [Dongiaceae bacterium]|nr:endo-1,4-beta-xylanase [Dongiaceae bacterium]